MTTNIPARWRQIDGHEWQYWASGYAVYGVVTFESLEQKYEWEARVMNRARIHNTPICGASDDLDTAKEIVEFLCAKTGTCLPVDSIQPMEKQP